MPVNLPPLNENSLHSVPGVKLGYAEAGIKKPGKKDLLIIALDSGSKVAGVFTKNRFCAAPVLVCQEHLSNTSAIRALLINTGNANAGTGESGLANAKRSCEEVARLLNLRQEEVLPFSTGVIMESLPIDRVVAGLPSCISQLKESNWLHAAHAIMTTDTAPKGASRQINIAGKTVTITGIAKGAGMIHPNMATMLGYVATDAAISQSLLVSLVKHAADKSFNRISVDGDTSTNDSFILIATGKSGLSEITDQSSAEYKTLSEAITDISIELAQAIVRDGEGATKFMTVKVNGGKNVEECEKVGFAIAHSPLIKTAFFASDPNLGRILAAIGYAGIQDLDVSNISLYLDDVLVAEKGGRAKSYKEEDGQKVMKQSEITIRIELSRGQISETFWTCDFSYDYVKINADYRS